MSSRNKIDPLHAAVMKRDLAEVKSTITSGSAVDGLDRSGRSPLFYATKNGDVSIVDELVKNGANVNVKDSGQETPLHFAARFYQVAAAEILLRSGADVNSKDAYGNTPLWRAVFESRGRGDVIKLLMSNGADKDLKNTSGVSPSDLAKSIANYKLTDFLI